MRYQWRGWWQKVIRSAGCEKEKADVVPMNTGISNGIGAGEYDVTGSWVDPKVEKLAAVRTIEQSESFGASR